MENQVEVEKIDPTVVLAMATVARQKTWDAIHTIKNLIYPGMTEKEAIKKANEYFADCGVKKFWHKTHIRFGESTVLSFNDPYYENMTLKEDDIFYIDVGPVWDNVEGDCGKTFVIGNSEKYINIAKDVKILFDEIHMYWDKTNVSGKELHEYANILVCKMGYSLLPSYVKGHRLSEFSHFKYSKLGIFDIGFKPSPERWVLEFQICHPSMKFGAFYEDLLI